MDETAHRSLYRITGSQVETVRVGSFVVDDDTGPRQDWSVFNPVTGRVLTFVGERTHRLCPECLGRPEPLVRVSGHEHPHGDGPILNPDEPTA